jgi:hypothetical protein
VTSSQDPKEAKANRAERGFYASHRAVEKAFGDSILTLRQLQERMNQSEEANCTGVEDSSNANYVCSFSANEKDNEEFLKQRFRTLAFNIRTAGNYLRHMRHFYDASHFFSQLRPFLKCGNIAENGIVFELPNEFKEYSIRLNKGSTRLIRSHEVIFGIRGPSGAGTTSLSSIDA